jgi:O-antigen ligase
VTALSRRNDALVAALGALACLFAGLAAAHENSMALLLTAGLCAIALIAVFQELGFGALIAWLVVSGPLYPLFSTGATDSPLGFDRIFIAGLGSWLVLRKGGQSWSPAARRLGYALLWLLAAFGLRAALTTPVGTATVGGDARLDAMNTWLDAIVLPVVLYFVVASFATTRERCLRIAAGMAVAGAILGAIGVAERVFGFELASLSGGSERIDDLAHVVRIAGPYSVPEVYACVLLVCLAGTLWWTLVRGSLSYPLGIAAVSLQLLGLALTLYRAAWIGALLIVIAALGLRPGRVFRAVGVSLAAALFLYFGYTQLQTNRTFENRLQNTENIKGRFAVYGQGVELFERHPLTGVGVGQFGPAQEEVQVTVVGGVEAVTSPHSTPLGLLAEQGILGFLPLLAIVYAATRLLANLRRRAVEKADVILWACVWGAAGAFVVMSLTLTMLPYGPSNAFVAIALGLAAARVNALSAPDDEPRPAR